MKSTILMENKFKKIKQVVCQDDFFYGKNDLIIDWLLPLKHKIKDCLRFLLKRNDLERSIKLIELDKSLYCEVSDYHLEYNPDGLLGKSKNDFDKNKSLYLLYISHAKEIIKKVKKFEEEILFREKNLTESQIKIKTAQIGELLGYPECCINFFSNNISATTPQLNFLVYRKSNNFFWQLNNLDARMNLLPHVPCDYCCKKSIKFAEKYLKAIQKEKGKEFVNKIENYLKSQFLYFKSGRFIRLEGISKNNLFCYSKIFYSELGINKFSETYEHERRIFHSLLKILKGGEYIFNDYRKEEFVVGNATDKILLTIRNYAKIFFCVKFD